MRKILRGQQGFTLIELVLIIVILGVLAAVAIPQFVNLQRDAQASANMGYIGGLRAAISIQYAAQILCKDGSANFAGTRDVMEGTGATECEPLTANAAPGLTVAGAESLVQGARPTSLTQSGTGACGTGSGWTGVYRDAAGNLVDPAGADWVLVCPAAGSRGMVRVDGSGGAP